MSAIDYFRETVENGVDYITSTELIDILTDTKKQLLAAAQRLADHLEQLGVHLHKTSVSSILSHISSSSSPPPPPDPSILRRMRLWCYSHRIGLGIVVCGSGFAVAALMIKHNAMHAARKRRSKRFEQTGEKAEIVVVSGYEQDSVIRSIVLDLERRGYVVVVVVSHQQAMLSIEREGKADLWPALFDGSNSNKNLLALLQTAVPNHPQLTYRFAGLVVSSTTQNSVNLARSMESLSSASDVIRNDLVSNSALIQTLLPHLLESGGHLVLLTHPTTHDLDFTPEIIAAQMVDDALGSLLRTIARQHTSLRTTQLKLGYFDLESSKLISPGTLTLFRPRRLGSTDRPWQRRVEPLRTLHNAVFDALSLSHPPRLRNVGSGSWMFSTLSNHVPTRVFERLLGLRFGKREEAVESDSEKDWETVG